MSKFDALAEMPELGLVSGSDLVHGICEAFFERDHQIITSDANILVGDSDGFYETPFLRFVLYLEATAHDAGALRFVPDRTGRTTAGSASRPGTSSGTRRISVSPAVTFPRWWSSPGPVTSSSSTRTFCTRHGTAVCVDSWRSTVSVNQ
ncbi:hypothetical protein [Streptomyces pseudovenezuelae]|uniref:Uncharacterized protein n=1 Tax=Streptomyces pseudovenezuelae TaxID=67350 RepID=A0ABT6M1Z6_9ACTN|nr:hypothetical protein [Streptomyces pseudovenezuelae]MDH6222109.1 hypothetical protein [Streptomyces pseudovenezuelae]